MKYFVYNKQVNSKKLIPDDDIEKKERDKQTKINYQCIIK